MNYSSQKKSRTQEAKLLPFYEIVQAMQTLTYILLITLTAACGRVMENPKKYVPRSERKKVKYATPEPGTYIRPMAFTLLSEINRVMKNPEDYKGPAQWVKDVLTARQQKDYRHRPFFWHE